MRGEYALAPIIKYVPGTYNPGVQSCRMQGRQTALRGHCSFVLYCCIMDHTRYHSLYQRVPTHYTEVQQYHTWSINILRSRPPRRTCSAYRPTSQPFSAQVMAPGSSSREVNMTAGEVLFLETMLLLGVSSALLVIWPPRNIKQTTKLFFLNLLFFF